MYIQLQSGPEESKPQTFVRIVAKYCPYLVKYKFCKIPIITNMYAKAYLIKQLFTNFLQVNYV